MKKLLLPILFLTFSGILLAQKFTISGYITDAESGEKLIGANVYDALTLKGVSTNAYGFYSITLPAGKVKITSSFVGYSTFQKEFDLKQNFHLNIELKPTIELQEVIVEGDQYSKRGGVESTQMSMIEIPVKTIQNIPMLMGETDIIKSVQLLPGVQSGSEGMTGLYVRGGGPDQNLILLDGVPVYNVNHLFGFFSVFNSDAVQNVTLIKGGFPARYGGRLSSVLDISMKEGNTKEFKASGSVGLISSKLMLEGPIGEKTSFMVTGRRTYLDVITYPMVKMVQKLNDVDQMYAGYYFYDLNAKINHQFNDRNRIYLSAYLGKDRMYARFKDEYTSTTWEDGEEKNVTYSEKDETEFWWGNITSALRWNYMVNEKLFANTTLTYSRYKMLVGNEYSSNGTWNTDYEFNYHSGINDWAGKIDFDYYPVPSHHIRFGVNETYHTYNPGVFYARATDNGETETANFGNRKLYSHETEAYLEDDWDIFEQLKANFGLHATMFNVKKVTYTSLQPRFSARWLVNSQLSIKASAVTMEQYINLLTNSNIGLPTDLWVPATDSIKPQKSLQYAVGAMYNANDKLEFSIEGFYKEMDNQVEYKEGATYFSFENDWQEKLSIGRGWSYGLEFLVMKKYGNTSGWIGYTWSKSERKFDRPGMEISYGKTFPYTYDRRHDVSIVLTHKFNERIDVGLTWVFGTGNATTLGAERYPSDEVTNGLKNPVNEYFNMGGGDITYYESRNNYRMPNYHRLDVGVNFHKEKTHGRRTWNISIYNAYNRQNPFFLTWDYDYKSKTYRLYQYSLFMIIPSFSYKFEIKPKKR